MSHYVCANSDLNVCANSDLNSAVDARSTAALRAGAVAPDPGVFDESEIKQMERVLEAVCQKLDIAPDSDAQREAALIILRQAAGSTMNSERLTELVIAELSR